MIPDFTFDTFYIGHFLSFFSIFSVCVLSISTTLFFLLRIQFFCVALSCALVNISVLNEKLRRNNLLNNTTYMYETETNVWYFGAYINKHIRYDFILRSTYKIVRAATTFYRYRRYTYREEWQNKEEHSDNEMIHILTFFFCMRNGRYQCSMYVVRHLNQ